MPAAAATLTTAPGTTSNASEASANGAIAATSTSTRAIITTEAALTAPARTEGTPSPARRRVAIVAVTAVEDAIDPAAAVASTPRSGPRSRAEKKPANE